MGEMLSDMDMRNRYIKPCSVLIAGLIMTEIVLSAQEDPCCVKETDVPSENRPYLPPAYTFGAIVASTASTIDFTTIL